jgi:hypothetical protein
MTVETITINPMIMFDVEDMFGTSIQQGIYCDRLFRVLIEDETILFASHSGTGNNLSVRYHCKDGFTGPQLLFLFTRQYKHWIAVYEGEGTKDFNHDIIDEKDMEGKWITLSNDDKRYSRCDYQLDGFDYNTVTKTVSPRLTIW